MTSNVGLGGNGRPGGEKEHCTERHRFLKSDVSIGTAVFLALPRSLWLHFFIIFSV